MRIPICQHGPMYQNSSNVSFHWTAQSFLSTQSQRQSRLNKVGLRTIPVPIIIHITQHTVYPSSFCDLQHIPYQLHSPLYQRPWQYPRQSSHTSLISTTTPIQQHNPVCQLKFKDYSRSTMQSFGPVQIHLRAPLINSVLYAIPVPLTIHISQHGPLY